MKNSEYVTEKMIIFANCYECRRMKTRVAAGMAANFEKKKI